MKLTEILTSHVQELNRINNAEALPKVFREGNGLPIFSTSENGYTVFFSEASLGNIRQIAATLFDEDLGISSVTELNNFQKLLGKLLPIYTLKMSC